VWLRVVLQLEEKVERVGPWDFFLWPHRSLNE
jgi:hypothetical protein